MSRRLEKAIRRERRASQETMAISASQVFQLTLWQQIGPYEFGYNTRGFTGYYRAVGGRLANGEWPTYYSRAAH